MGVVRVLLALAVLLSHLPPASYKILSGALAVQAFFVVSGFYMALVLDGKYRDTWLFYSNRILRLAPTYAFMCGLGAFTLFALNASITGTPEIFERLFSNPVSAVVMAFENIFVVGQDLLFWFTVDGQGNLVFDAHAEPGGEEVIGWQGLLAPQSWSLSTELMFYAIAPLVTRMRLGWMVLLAAASVGLRLAGHWLDVDYLLWQGRFFPTALFLFLLGAIGYRALPLVAKLPKALGWIAAAGLIGYCLAFSFLPMDPLKARWVTYAVVALTVPPIFHAFKDVAWDRWIGDLSYPVYLSQLIVIGLVLTYKWPFPVWTSIGLTFAVSIAVMVLIERPVDRWRQKRLARRQAALERTAA